MTASSTLAPPAPSEGREDTPRVAFFHTAWALGDQIALGASDYWRLATPAAELFSQGWDVILGRSIARGPDGTLHVMGPTGDWHRDREIIVWQNWMGEGAAEAIRGARAAGQVMINDLDDHYWDFPADHVAGRGTDPATSPQFNRDLYREILDASSLITVSTPFLRDLDWNAPVRVVPNFITVPSWPLRPPGDHVGWIGCVPWRGRDLEVLRETVVPWLRARGDFFYHGGDMEDARSAAEILGYDRVTTRPAVSIAQYPSLWDPLRIALIPIEDTPFGRAKSYVKGLEACARGIPFVASDHPEYRALGVGRLVSRPEDWVRHLEELQDPDVYAAECQANRARAEELSMERNAGRWADVFREAVARDRPNAALRSRALIPSTLPRKKLVTVDLNVEYEQLLTSVPSATTINERKLALYAAQYFWDGRTDVFENGPLLGGVTRALALGMLQNEARDDAARLHAYDWWNAREPLDLPPDVFPTIASWGPRYAEAVALMNRTGSFRPVFRELAQGYGYDHLVRDEVGYLPGHRGERASDDAVDFSLLGRDRPFSLLFVDGCKSWYGTKHWLREVADHVEVGAHFLFQDFGWYTCFWIPSMVALLRKHFEPEAYVDHTYGWRLVAPLSRATVEEAIPDEPTDIPRNDYERLFQGLIDEAEGRADRFGCAALSTQRAAAYAYIGEKDEARAIIDDLLRRLEFVPMRSYLKAARRAPTYRPDGTEVTL